VELMGGKTYLPQVVLTVRAGRGISRHLHRRNGEAEQDADDRNDDEKLDEGEAVAPIAGSFAGID
jgi:hypothetical protein